ncbi:hypothetical protein ACFZAV_40640 [Streptomyces sp. NPDC008343]|uniref:hypothetical protein n=1 Tax=Streptomyces sp. NPDC008343 TaxID=3364828 RepID=UPI0036E84A5A
MRAIPSTDVLPDVLVLLDRCRALAALSALAQDDGPANRPPVYALSRSLEGSRHRYGPQTAAVGPVLSMAHGDHHFDVLFSEAGTLVWGLAGTDEPLCVESQPYEGEGLAGCAPFVPEELRGLLPRQPFSVLVWRRPGDDAWQVVDPSGALSGDRALLHDLTATRPDVLKWLRSKRSAKALWDVLDLPAGASERDGWWRDAPEGEEVFRCHDESGMITTAVFRRTASDRQPVHLGLRAGVAEGMAVIGGGAVARGEPYGALLTASCPSSDGGAWVVASKDHLVAQPHRLTGYAIGLAIKGVSPERLARELLLVRRVRSTRAAHPSAAAPAPGGYVLIGGGFHVNWHDGAQGLGAGSLATASFPLAGSSWQVRAKDHLVGHPCTVDAYAVCLKSSFTVDGRRYRVDRRIRFAESGLPTAHPAAVASFGGSGCALTGIGAEVRRREPGSMLWRLEPPTRDGVPAAAVGGTEHMEPAPSTAAAFALGIRLDADDPHRPAH